MLESTKSPGTMFAPNPIATNEIFLNSVAQNHVKYI